MLKKIKDSKGIVTADVLIAIMLFIIFTGIIATLSYNIYITSAYIKRTAKANNYVIEILEYAELIDFDNTTDANIVDYINTKYQSTGELSAKIAESENILTTPYKAEIKVENYKDNTHTIEENDYYLLKKITVSLKYIINDKENNITIERLKPR